MVEHQTQAQAQVNLQPASSMRFCTRCATYYDFHRSGAYLKLTFCSSMCESNQLRFDIRKFAS